MNSHIEFKAQLAVDDAGALTALAWPFGSADRVGDMITKGAFANAAVPFPMLMSHDTTDPIGVWSEAKEQADGLHLKGRLLIDDVPRARQVHALVRSGAIRGVSIGFVTRKSVKRAGGGRTISELELLEASLVTIPMHPGAMITSAKSAIRAIAIAEAINRAAAALNVKAKR